MKAERRKAIPFVKHAIAVSILFTVTYSLLGESETGTTRLTDQQRNDNCYWNGHKLYGRIKFVTSFPDIKAKVVTSFPHLKVKIVEHAPTKCGEWKIVNEFPDLKVQLVDSSPDIKIQFVQSFPGLGGSK